MTEISGYAWPLAPHAIDYIAENCGLTLHDACLRLQKELREERISARGPLDDAEASLIPSEFWRFALPDQNGTAVNIKSMKVLHWFEVCADDVVAVFGDSSDHIKRRKPLSAARYSEVIEFVKILGPLAEDDAWHRAEEKFNASIPRDRFRQMRTKADVKGLPGRKRKNPAEK